MARKTSILHVPQFIGYWMRPLQSNLVPAARAVRRGNRVVSKVSVVDSDGHDKEQQGMTHKIGDVVSNDTGNSRVEAPYWNGIR
ncbi:hypothetical protein BC938DRAFT_480509 [Jimgerdemannia flammicorona]|uniref:Uncharacterized protein n=1 Tax=Jimgerdemannia flammicorona TaxID=994334 RepID=A0A433QIB9_9FUNG|nr:hypothetical protein BC938DRAFT_480509 [Jimgerdemannia flammicorona]